MSRSVNKAIILGNLGRDPEVRSTRDGTAVATLSIATTASWEKDGKPNEKTTWHRVVAWGKLAEVCGKYLVKGRQVYIEGSIEHREWTDKGDNKRTTTEIKAQTLIMLGPKDQPSQASLEDQIFGKGEEPPF